MKDLPRSLESRAREWINTPPQYRGSCPSCGARYGHANTTSGIGFEHGRGCWVKIHRLGLVFGPPPCPECGGPPDTGAGHDCEAK